MERQWNIRSEGMGEFFLKRNNPGKENSFDLLLSAFCTISVSVYLYIFGSTNESVFYFKCAAFVWLSKRELYEPCTCGTVQWYTSKETLKRTRIIWKELNYRQNKL